MKLDISSHRLQMNFESYNDQDYRILEDLIKKFKAYINSNYASEIKTKSK